MFSEVAVALLHDDISLLIWKSESPNHVTFSR